MKQSINKLKNITMKIKQLFLAAMTMLAFGACTFIPESPYNFPSSGGGENGGTNSDYYINETFATRFGVFSTVETVGNYPWVIDYSTAKAHLRAISGKLYSIGRFPFRLWLLACAFIPN